jgi:hypothetical protein
VARTFAREGAMVYLSGRNLRSVNVLTTDIIAAGGKAEAAGAPPRMSGPGPERTCRRPRLMSAHRGEADSTRPVALGLLLTRSRHCGDPLVDHLIGRSQQRFRDG